MQMCVLGPDQNFVSSREHREFKIIWMHVDYGNLGGSVPKLQVYPDIIPQHKGVFTITGDIACKPAFQFCPMGESVKQSHIIK